MKTIGVIIGRFQGPHLMHKEIIKKALNECNEVLILIGSCNSTDYIKNPFSTAERMMLLDSMFSREEYWRISYDDLHDWPTDDLWCSEVRLKINESILCRAEPYQPILYGSHKDASTYYLNYFPELENRTVTATNNISSTQIREAWRKNNLNSVKNLLDPNVLARLKIMEPR